MKEEGGSRSPTDGFYSLFFITSMTRWNEFGPTGPFSILEPQNQEIGLFCVASSLVEELQSCERFGRAFISRFLVINYVVSGDSNVEP